MAGSSQLDGSSHSVPAPGISGTLADCLARLRLAFPKDALVSLFEWFGGLGFFCMRTLRAALVPPFEFRELLRQCDEIGSKSLPLVALAGAATGVVLSLETRDSLVRFGAKYFCRRSLCSQSSKRAARSLPG